MPSFFIQQTLDYYCFIIYCGRRSALDGARKHLDCWKNYLGAVSIPCANLEAHCKVNFLLLRVIPSPLPHSSQEKKELFIDGGNPFFFFNYRDSLGCVYTLGIKRAWLWIHAQLYIPRTSGSVCTHVSETSR